MADKMEPWEIELEAELIKRKAVTGDELPDISKIAKPHGHDGPHAHEED